jgi:hypothetical protein
VPKPSPYISMVSTYLLSCFDLWYQSSVNPFLPLLNFAYNLPCLFRYIGGCIVIRTLHITLQCLHCPSFSHQVLNLACLIMGLAQSPKAWIIVNRDLGLYVSWVKILCAVSATMFAIALASHRSARSYILECQHQVHRPEHSNNTTQGRNSLPLSHAGKLLERLEVMSLALLLFPPLIMGTVVLFVPR